MWAVPRTGALGGGKLEEGNKRPYRGTIGGIMGRNVGRVGACIRRNDKQRKGVITRQRKAF